MVAGIVLELLFASLAMWTVYLMTLLYLDHKNRKVTFCNQLAIACCASHKLYHTSECHACLT